MSKKPVFDDPSQVSAADGIVSVEGPGGVDVDLTFEAAEETSDRLLGAAMKARGQALMKDVPHQPK